jgi:hypothetical protein
MLGALIIEIISSELLYSLIAVDCETSLTSSAVKFIRKVIIGVAVGADVAQPPVKPVELDSAVHVKITDITEETKRLKPDATLAPNDIGEISH